MSFDFEFNYQIDGRKVSKDEWMRHLGQEAVAKAMPQVAQEREAEVVELRCGVHGESPTVTHTTSGDQIKFQIKACCDELLEQAQKVAVGN